MKLRPAGKVSRPSAVGALVAVLSLGSFLSSFPAPAGATPASVAVVVGEVYGGGGSVGATYNRDFVELVNRGETAVNLGGWSVQSAGPSSSSWVVMATLPDRSLAPGQHFLLGAVGGSSGASLPTVDSNSQFGLGVSGGRVALVAGVGVLGCGTSCAGTPSVLDLVGYGSAVEFEGSGPAPAGGASSSVGRLNGGCTDTDQNAADFSVLSPPRPESTSTPRPPCSATVPSAPHIGSATAGSGQATITWSAPASDGGSPVTSYTVTASPGGATVVVPGDVAQATVTGLTNGTAYTFTVRATNLVGDSAESASSNPVTPATRPGPPVMGGATAGNGEATVSFTPPADDGGNPVTSYTVTSTPGGITATGAASPIIVTGLTNGTTYTFTVHATNTAGDSPESAASNPVTPATVASAPVIGTATAGQAQATVTWTAPASDGGSPVTSYTVTASPGGATATAAADATQALVSGLTAGTTYTFTVHATNAVGNSAPSAPSNPVTPTTVPSAPVMGGASAGNGQASVSFTPPADDGGSPVTSYTVTSTPGGITATGISSPITVTGLLNGTTYTFTVHATNVVGDSNESARSNPVTPNAARPNTAPTVTSFTVPVEPVGVNVALQASAAFSDADADDTHTCTLSWGDSTPATVLAGVTRPL